MNNTQKFIIFGLMVIFITGIFLKTNQTDTETFFENNRTREVKNLMISEEGYFLRIASCPTFYYMLDKMEGENEIKTIKTKSTAESLRLLSEGEVDLIISGRALKVEEPKFLFEKIGPGYDFIFNQEILISEQEMALITFYTDLSLNKIIEDFAFISEDNLLKIENIYQFLDKGIIITFLENQLVGESVYIFKEDQTRLRLSRLPRIYYSTRLEEEKLEFIKEIIKEN